MAIARKRIKAAAAGLILLGGLLWLAPDLPCRAEIAAIRVYQRLGSPLMGKVVTCRFNPTCSHYAVQVLRERGFWGGNLRIAKRLLMCSPLGALSDAA